MIDSGGNGGPSGDNVLSQHPLDKPDPEDILPEGSAEYGEFFDAKELSVYSVLHDAGTSIPGTVKPLKSIFPKHPDFSQKT